MDFRTITPIDHTESFQLQIPLARFHFPCVSLGNSTEKTFLIYFCIFTPEQNKYMEKKIKTKTIKCISFSTRSSTWKMENMKHEIVCCFVIFWISCSLTPILGWDEELCLSCFKMLIERFHFPYLSLEKKIRLIFLWFTILTIEWITVSFS